MESMEPRRPVALLFLLVSWCGCPDHSEVIGPDGEPIGEDECLLTVLVGDSCDGCEGFERFEVTIEDAGGTAWEMSLGVGDSWSDVIAAGGFTVNYYAVLFDAPHDFDPATGYCNRVHDLSIGCGGFDFCE